MIYIIYRRIQYSYWTQIWSYFCGSRVPPTEPKYEKYSNKIWTAQVMGYSLKKTSDWREQKLEISNIIEPLDEAESVPLWD